MVGVFSLELARLYQYLFQETGNDYTIIHALDGFDEISLTADCKIISNDGEKLINPAYFGFQPVQIKELYGGSTVEEAATIFKAIIEGKGTPAQNNIVLINAAIAIQTYHHYNINKCIEIANESLFSLDRKSVV